MPPPISTSSNIQIVLLTSAICAQGWQLAENGDSAAFRVLLENWDLLMRRMLDSQNPTLLDTVILSGSARIATNHLAPAAEKLGLTAEAERLKQTQQRLLKLRESAKAATLLIAGRPPATRDPRRGIRIH